MSYALVCHHPDVFVGAASLIGTMSGATWESCQPDRPVPILQISGTADVMVPIDGSMDRDGGWGGAPEMDVIVDFWVEHNRCAESRTEEWGANVNTIQHTACENEAEVWYTKLEGYGHHFPLGNDDSGVDVMAEIGEFFSRF